MVDSSALAFVTASFSAFSNAASLLTICFNSFSFLAISAAFLLAISFAFLSATAFFLALTSASFFAFFFASLSAFFFFSASFFSFSTFCFSALESLEEALVTFDFALCSFFVALEKAASASEATLPAAFCVAFRFATSFSLVFNPSFAAPLMECISCNNCM